MAGRLPYFFRKGIRIGQALLIRTEWERKVFFLQKDFPGEIERRGEGVFLKKLNVLVPLFAFEFVLDAYGKLRLFAEQRDVTFAIEQQTFFVFWNGLKLSPTTAEEIFIIEEIYSCGTYNYRANGKFVVIDIGMNVGFASLYFASKHEVTKVYGFEPFAPTYRQALVNIGHNANERTKIECHSFGLGEISEEIEVDYNYENKGQVGIHGTALIRGEVISTKETIVLRQASNELKKIYAQHTGERFIFKIDCEGAEYGILKDMAAHNLLDVVDMIFIEWHEKGPDELLNILTRHNFKSFYQQAAGKKVGLIYATR